MGEYWRELVNMFAWPAWLLVLIPTPLALITAFSAGFSRCTDARVWRMPIALRRGGMAGVVIVLPVTVLGGLLLDAVDLGRSAVVGVAGGMAIGAVGGFVAVTAWHFGLKNDPWRVYYSGTLLGDMGWDVVVWKLKYVDPKTDRWRWRHWRSWRW